MNTTIKNTSTNLIASVHENAYETLMSSLNELDTICEIENKFFKFIKNNKMRHNLAAAFLGARYIFLLGKELKVRDELSRVMLRIQLLEYASICEAILNAIHWDWEKQALLQIVENRFAPRRPTLIQRGILGSPAAGWAPRRCQVA